MENKKLFQYISGGCFIIIALISLIGNLGNSYGFVWTMLVFPLCFVLIAIGLFVNQPLLSGIVAILYSLYSLTSIGIILGNSYIPTAYKFSYILGFVSYIFLAITLFSKNKLFGIISGAVHIVSEICSIIAFGANGSGILSTLIFAVGVILVGISLNTQQKKGETTNVMPTKSGATNSIEQITKLKELLDKGIITQEEFDAKKTQILGN